MEFYKWLFIIACCIGVIGGITTGIIDMKRGRCKRGRKSSGVLGYILAPILLLGALDKASNKLKRCYVRPKHRGVMCSGSRRGKR